MKVYTYYKLQKGLAPVLYAFTKDKDIMSRFKNERDMTQFYEKIIDVDKRDYKSFADKRKGLQLGIHQYTTRSLEDRNKKVIIDLASTMFEDENIFIMTDKILMEIAKYTFNASFFKDEVLEVLNELNFFDIYLFKRDNELSSSLWQGDSFYSGMENNRFDNLSFVYDQLSLFIYFYGNTMKLKKEP